MQAVQKCSDARRTKSCNMRRTCLYAAVKRDERNAADVVPAQAGIGVFQQPVEDETKGVK